MNIRPAFAALGLSMAFVFMSAPALADDAAPAVATPVAPVAPVAPVQVDAFLGVDPAGKLVVWNGAEQVPLPISVAKIGGPKSTDGYAIVGNLLFFIEGNNLRAVDLRTRQVRTIRAGAFRSKAPERTIAIDEPTKSIVLAAGRTETYESCETEWVEAESVSIPIPADAGIFDKKPVTTTCAWQAPVSTRPTLEINVKNRVISLVTKNKKRFVARERLSATENYNSCMEPNGDASYCAEIIPKISCSQMVGNPFSFCHMVTLDWGEQCAQPEYDFFWFSEKTMKTLAKSSSSGGQSSGGCWNVLDNKLVGPWPVPEAVGSLEFITWL